MFSEQDIIERLTGICGEWPRDGDDYDEWASRAIAIYQSILDEMGLTIFTVMGGQPNGDYVDCIDLRTPWGEVSTIPDPEDIDSKGKTTYDTKYIVEAEADEHTHEMEQYCYIRELVLFFMKLGEGVKTLNRVKNMDEISALLLLARGGQVGDKPAVRDDALKKMFVCISVILSPVTISGWPAKLFRIQGRERLGTIKKVQGRDGLIEAGFYWNEELKSWREFKFKPERIVGDAEPDDPRLPGARSAWESA